MLKILQGKQASKDLNWLVLPTLLAFIGGGVYFDYLAFNKLYIFRKFASDSLSQFFPWLYFYSSNLTSLEFPFWSYQFELGMNIYTLSINHNPFDLLLALTGENNLIYAIPYIVILKIITAGLFFYGYLKKMSLASSVALICSVSFSFCGYMIVNGHWYHYQNYAVFIAVALFCFERWYQNGRWLALVLIFGFSNMIGALQLVQLALFFSIYIPFRFILDGQVRLRSVIKCYFFFAIMFMLGIGISAFYLLPNADIILQSARSDHSVGDIARLSIFSNLFSFPSLADWRMILFRYLSSDILGSFQHYKGVGSYLESPAAYIGLASFAVIPGVIWIRPFHKKMALLGLLVVCLLYFLFPILRTAVNLFASSTYKYAILYISVFLLILAGFSLDNFFKNPVIRNHFVISIAATIFLLLAGVNLLAFTGEIKTVVNRKILMVVDIFLCFYLLLLSAYALGWRRWIRLFIIGVMVFEIALFAKITVRRASGIAPSFITQGKCYFDEDTNEIIDYLKTRDNDFYRISKGNHGCTLNDALIQGYNGTTGYHGFASAGLVSFYATLGLSRSSPRISSYRYGFDRSPYLMSLFNVKYYISDNMFVCPEGFKFIKRFGNRYLFENQYQLPLGISYSSKIPILQFVKKAYSARRALLLEGFIGEKTRKQFKPLKTLDSEQINGIKDVASEVFDWSDNIETLNMRMLSPNNIDNFHYMTTSKDPKIFFPLERARYFNDLKIKIDIESEDDTLGQVFWKIDAFDQKNSIMFRVTKGRRTYILEVGKVTFNALRVDVGAKSGMKIHIHDIRLFTHRVIGVDFERRVAQLKSDSLRLVEFSEDYLKGTIETNTDKMLFFAIPYDRGWSARLNGQKWPLQKINFGFMGLGIPPGKHTVELQFRPRLLHEGIFVSVLSIFITIALYCRYPLFSPLPENSYPETHKEASKNVS